MVSYRPHIAFSLIMGAYFLIRYMRSTFPGLPDFVRFHLTDLLFVPAMCLFALLAVRYLKRDHSLSIPGIYVLLQTVLVALYFEMYLPESYPGRYTADAGDAVMYVLGGLLFVAAQRRL